MTTKVSEANIPQILATIRKRESNNNYTAHAKKGSASGAYQFIDSTWRSMAKAAGVDTSQYPTAMSAPPELQDKVATAYVRNILQSNGWDAEAVPAVWYIGHVPKGSEWDTVPAPEYGNTATPRSYVSSWMKAFNGSSGPSSPQQTGGITPGSTALNNMTDDEIKDYIAANYGYAAGYLNVPEVGAILVDAARKGQTPAQVQARIANTTWWKTTTDSVRQFQGIASSDPATAQRMIAQKQASISDQAAAMGANIDPATLKTIAWEALSFGWSDAQLNDALLGEMKKDPTATSAPRGQMAANIAAVKQLGAQYGISISDPQAQEYSFAMLDGKLTQQGLQAMMINQAKGKYPSLAGVIDQGITPQQFFAPYQSEAAKLLDVPDASINLFNDPRFSDVLQVPGDKGPRPMTISEFQQKVRTLPEWKQTQNAQQTASDVTEFLSRKFGAVA